MTKLLAAASFLLVAFVPSAAPAQPRQPAGETSAAVSEAMLDRFLAALPESPAAAMLDRTPNAGELSRLSALNPGREAEIRAILIDHAGCVAPAMIAATQRQLRDIGRSLGPARLVRLTQFYEGADYTVFARIAPRIQRGEAVPAADARALNRILAAYPLVDFNAAFGAAQQNMMNDEGLVGRLRSCASATHEALDRQGLRRN